MKTKLYSVSVIFLDPDVCRKIGFSPWSVWWDRAGPDNVRDFNRVSKASLARLHRVVLFRDDGRFMFTPWGWCYYTDQ